MSDQTIHTPDEANGKPIMVGNRGGLKTKDGITASKPVRKPAYTLEGPGYSIGLFKGNGGFEIRYKGPNSEDVVKRLKEYVNEGLTIEECINKIRSED